jgi:vacuolar-type H+-ATPase subunit I/STV1
LTNEDLSENDRHEVWLIACELGIDTVRARAEWERRKAQNRPQPEPKEEEVEEVQEVEEEPSEYFGELNSEFEEQRLENERRKSVILDQIQKNLEDEENEEEETNGLARVIKENSGIESLTKGFLSVLGTLLKFEDPQKLIITVEKDGNKLVFSWKMTNKDGSETMFDTDGTVIKVRGPKK